MVAMVGVMLATGAERSAAAWLGSVGPVEVGVLVEVEPGPESWIWTGILVGATMLCREVLRCGAARLHQLPIPKQVRRAGRQRYPRVCGMCRQLVEVAAGKVAARFGEIRSDQIVCRTFSTNAAQVGSDTKKHHASQSLGEGGK